MKKIIMLIAISMVFASCTNYDDAVKYIQSNGYSIKNMSPRPMFRARGYSEVFIFNATKAGKTYHGLISERMKINGDLDWEISAQLSNQHDGQ